MGALKRMSRGLGQVDLGLPVGRYGFTRRLGIATVGTGVGIAASYGLGQIHGRYGHHESVKHVPLYTGIAGKALALLVSAMNGGPSYLGGILSETGQAGLNLHFAAWGIEQGAKAAGRRYLVLPPGADVPKGLPAGTRETVLGEIPPAAPGRYLRRDRLQSLAAQL